MADENQIVPKYSVAEHNRATHASLLRTIVTIFSRLVAIPLFILAHKNLPELEWAFHLDRILLFFIVFGFTELLLKWINNVVAIGLIVVLAFLTFGTLTGNYGFGDMVKDYQVMVVSMYESPKPQEFIASKFVLYPNRTAILKAINYQNPIVRDFALEAISTHFVAEQKHSQHRQWIQSFAIFKEINSRWNYVNDPKGEDYYAAASETIRHLAGDCDDHAVLMSACIKSIGGTMRLIHTDGHLYPEILIGNHKDMDKANYLIKKELFTIESRGKSLFFHTEKNGQVWLNLDYTARYPGGTFMSEKNLGVLNLE